MALEVGETFGDIPSPYGGSEDFTLIRLVNDGEINYEVLNWEGDRFLDGKGYGLPDLFRVPKRHPEISI